MTLQAFCWCLVGSALIQNGEMVDARAANCDDGAVCTSHSLLQTNAPDNLAATLVEDDDAPAAAPVQKSKARRQQRQPRRKSGQGSGAAMLQKHYMQRPSARVVEETEVVKPDMGSAMLQKATAQVTATLPSHVLEEDIAKEKAHVKRVFSSAKQAGRKSKVTKSSEKQTSKIDSGFDGDGTEDNEDEDEEDAQGKGLRTEDEKVFEADDEEQAGSEKKQDEEEVTQKEGEMDEEKVTSRVPSKASEEEISVDHEGQTVTAERMSKTIGQQKGFQGCDRRRRSEVPDNLGKVVGNDEAEVAAKTEMAVKAAKEAVAGVKTPKQMGKPLIKNERKLAAIEQDIEVSKSPIKPNRESVGAKMGPLGQLKQAIQIQDIKDNHVKELAIERGVAIEKEVPEMKTWKSSTKSEKLSQPARSQDDDVKSSGSPCRKKEGCPDGDR